MKLETHIHTNPAYKVLQSYTHNCQNSGSLLFIIRTELRCPTTCEYCGISRQQNLFNTKIIVIKRHGGNSNAHLSESPSAKAMYCVIPTTIILN